MPDWALALIGVAIIALICFCGEIASWVKQEEDNTLGLKRVHSTSSKTYLGAPMRKRFKGFDLEGEKKEKKEKKDRTMAHLDDMPELDLAAVGGGNGVLINLTPRDADGNEQLMSVDELAKVSRGQYVSEREKELESRDKKNLSAQELGELYTLQIKSAAKEVHIRDQHLQLLAKNVEEARALAARSHEEAVSWAHDQGYQGKMPSPSSERSAPSFGHHSELEGLRAPARDPEDPPP